MMMMMDAVDGLCGGCGRERERMDVCVRDGGVVGGRKECWYRRRRVHVLVLASRDLESRVVASGCALDLNFGIFRRRLRQQATNQHPRERGYIFIVVNFGVGQSKIKEACLLFVAIPHFSNEDFYNTSDDGNSTTGYQISNSCIFSNTHKKNPSKIHRPDRTLDSPVVEAS